MRRRMYSIAGMFVAVLCVASCCPLTPGEQLELRGVFVDSSTMSPLVGMTFTGRTFTDGQETDFHNSIHYIGHEESDEDGNFTMLFSGGPGGRGTDSGVSLS